jgi:cold shock CspA family protein
MTGTITRLVDNRQVGVISAEDGNEYAFGASNLRGAHFDQLSLGTAVTFTPGRNSNELRAEAVQLVR